MTQLKHSASEWCFFKKHPDPPAYYRRLKEAGFSGVEMVDPARWQMARAAGLEILNLVAPGMQKGLNRIEDHATILPQIRAAIAQAGEARIPQVIIFSGNRAGLADEDGIRNCIAGIRQIVGDAEKAKVQLIFETLNSFDHKDYQGDRGQFAFSIVKAISSPNLRVLYDIYHMDRMGENIHADIVKNLELVAHLHIAGSPKRDFPGESQRIDYARLINAVHAAGYRGYWGHEFCTGSDPLKEAADSVALFEKYAAEGKRKN
jgi:hydroxypyruvate isomerase